MLDGGETRPIPSAHALSARGRGVRVRQDLVLEAKVVASGRKHLSVERIVRPCADPLRSLDEGRSLGRSTRYAGFEHEVTLLEASRDGVASEARVLARLHPGGTLVVPTSARWSTATSASPRGSTARASGRGASG